MEQLELGSPTKRDSSFPRILGKAEKLATENEIDRYLDFPGDADKAEGGESLSVNPTDMKKRFFMVRKSSDIQNVSQDFAR